MAQSPPCGSARVQATEPTQRFLARSLPPPTSRPAPINEQIRVSSRKSVCVRPCFGDQLQPSFFASSFRRHTWRNETATATVYCSNSKNCNLKSQSRLVAVRLGCGIFAIHATSHANTNHSRCLRTSRPLLKAMAEEQQVQNDKISGVFGSHCDSLPAARSLASSFRDQKGNKVAAAFIARRALIAYSLEVKTQ